MARRQYSGISLATGKKLVDMANASYRDHDGVHVSTPEGHGTFRSHPLPQHPVVRTYVVEAKTTITPADNPNSPTKVGKGIAYLIQRNRFTDELEYFYHPRSPNTKVEVEVFNLNTIERFPPERFLVWQDMDGDLYTFKDEQGAKILAECDMRCVLPGRVGRFIKYELQDCGWVKTDPVQYIAVDDPQRANCFTKLQRGFVCRRDDCTFFDPELGQDLPLYEHIGSQGLIRIGKIGRAFYNEPEDRFEEVYEHDVGCFGSGDAIIYTQGTCDLLSTFTNVIICNNLGHPHCLMRRHTGVIRFDPGNPEDVWTAESWQRNTAWVGINRNDMCQGSDAQLNGLTPLEGCVPAEEILEEAFTGAGNTFNREAEPGDQLFLKSNTTICGRVKSVVQVPGKCDYIAVGNDCEKQGQQQQPGQSNKFIRQAPGACSVEGQLRKVVHDRCQKSKKEWKEQLELTEIEYIKNAELIDDLEDFCEILLDLYPEKACVLLPQSTAAPVKSGGSVKFQTEDFIHEIELEVDQGDEGSQGESGYDQCADPKLKVNVKKSPAIVCKPSQQSSQLETGFELELREEDAYYDFYEDDDCIYLLAHSFLVLGASCGEQSGTEGDQIICADPCESGQELLDTLTYEEIQLIRNFLLSNGAHTNLNSGLERK